MEKRPAKTVLLIENDPKEARLVHEMLNESISCVFELTHVESMRDAERLLAGKSVDIVLLDLGLADSHGLETVSRVLAAAPRVSIVLSSSANDEAIAFQGIREGVQDYLIKGQIKPRELIRALLNSAGRKIIENIRFIEKERAQVTLDCIGDGLICTDASGSITFMNRLAESMTGWTREDAAGRRMAECVPIVDAVTRKAICDPMAKAISQNAKGNLPSNCVFIRRDGHEVFIEDSVAPIHDSKGEITGAVIVFHEVTAAPMPGNEFTHLSWLYGS
jgi:PAS domain S-box-containing protein